VFWENLLLMLRPPLPLNQVHGLRCPPGVAVDLFVFFPSALARGPPGAWFVTWPRDIPGRTFSSPPAALQGDPRRWRACATKLARSLLTAWFRRWSRALYKLLALAVVPTLHYPIRSFQRSAEQQYRSREFLLVSDLCFSALSHRRRITAARCDHAELTHSNFGERKA
jgi:hypothetical protein